MRAYVDPNACVSCGLCVSLVPEVFAVGENGLAEAVSDTTPETQAAVEEAIDSCPVNAIRPDRP